MAKIILSYNVAGRDGTLGTVPTEVEGAPISNLFLRHPGDLWQSPGLADADLAFTIQLANAPGATTPRWDLLSFLYMDVTITDDVRIRAAATEAATLSDPTYDETENLYKGASPTVIPWKDSDVQPFVHHVSAGVRTEQWIHIQFISTHPNGYIRVGNCIIDEAIAPARNFSTPLTMGPPARFDIKLLSEADAMIMHTAEAANKDEGLLAVFDPAATEYIHNNVVWGLERQGQGVTLTNRDYYSKRFTIEPFI